MKELRNSDVVFETIVGLIVRLAEHGLIHCDFNEFNIMVSFECYLLQLHETLLLCIDVYFLVKSPFHGCIPDIYTLYSC